MLSLARENASAKALSDADWTMSTAMGSATVQSPCQNESKQWKAPTPKLYRRVSPAKRCRAELQDRGVQQANFQHQNHHRDDHHRYCRCCRRAAVIESSELGQDLD